jgi:hypothetical protein
MLDPRAPPGSHERRIFFGELRRARGLHPATGDTRNKKERIAVPSNPGALLESYNALIKGLQTKPPAGASDLAVQGKVYAIADLVMALTIIRDVLAAVPAAHDAHVTALQARADIEPRAVTFLDDTCTAVRGALGTKSTNLSVYGIKPRKTAAPLTAEQQVEKTTKAAATRKARGTLGKKQKAKIKGQVPPPPAPKPGQ